MSPGTGPSAQMFAQAFTPVWGVLMSVYDGVNIFSQLLMTVGVT